MNERYYIVIILAIAAVYAWTCYTMGEGRSHRQHDAQNTATRIFGRAYYSRATMEWLGRGVGHAHKMTGKELAQYDSKPDKATNRRHT